MDLQHASTVIRSRSGARAVAVPFVRLVLLVVLAYSFVRVEHSPLTPVDGPAALTPVEVLGSVGGPMVDATPSPVVVDPRVPTTGATRATAEGGTGHDLSCSRGKECGPDNLAVDPAP
jgi:hypothetical protein